jgi:hypothetical protein
MNMVAKLFLDYYASIYICQFFAIFRNFFFSFFETSNQFLLHYCTILILKSHLESSLNFHINPGDSLNLTFIFPLDEIFAALVLSEELQLLSVDGSTAFLAD